MLFYELNFLFSFFHPSILDSKLEVNQLDEKEPVFNLSATFVVLKHFRTRGKNQIHVQYKNNNRQTDRQTDSQTDRETDRQTARRTGFLVQ